MKIGFVAPMVTAIKEPHVGGSQALLADIATGLAQRGHDVSVFAATGSEIDGVEVVDTGIDASALVATLFRADASDVETADVTREVFSKVYELVRGRQLDVVHNHAFDAPAIELADVGVPVVHTLHLPPTPSIAASIERAPRRPVIACVSESSAKGWRALIDVDVVLRNGVPVDRIPWRSAPGRGALFAGRLSPEKGAAEAIEIASRADIRSTLVGDAYDANYAASLDADVRPSVPRAELWELMKDAAVVLCPVSWDEPFGLVAAEAQACGTPVVAFDRGALPEVIVDGVTGVLVNDVEGAVAGIDSVASLDRRACRAHAEQDLDLRATLDAHEALYASLLGCSTP